MNVPFVLMAPEAKKGLSWNIEAPMALADISI